MSDLGDVLELLHTSSQRWHSLRLAGHEWRHHVRLHLAFERHFASAGGQALRVVAFRSQTGEQGADYREPEDGREEWRMWLAKPDRVRTEFEVGTETVTAILIGDRWWSRSPSRYVANADGDPRSSHGRGPQEALVDTARHLGSLRLRVADRTSFLSRPAYSVSATPEAAEPHGFNNSLHLLGLGADVYRLVVDAKLGILLRIQAELEGAPFRVVEVDEVAADEPMDDALFDPIPLRDSRV
jgi:hypothetical protein